MQLHYSRAGSGPKLLLIHGFLEDSSMWDFLKLETQFDCIRLDLPGHGHSPEWSKSEANLEFASQCVLETLENIGFDNFHIMGHSLGGYLALQLSASYPDSKIILLNSNFWTDSLTKQKDRLRVVDIVEKNRLYFIREAIPSLFYQKENHPSEIEQAIEVAKKCSTESIQAATLAMRCRKDFSKEMPLLSNRLMILQGEKDKSTTLGDMNRRSAGLTLKIIPDCGHMCHIENAGLVVKEVGNFLID